MNSNEPIAPRPSQRLPWADPTIARLVAMLQDEVRIERASDKAPWYDRRGTFQELDPPNPTSEPDWDWADETRWNPRGDSHDVT